MIVSVKDGKTPHIGANGNWWIGETDTGVKAEYTETDPTVPAWAKEPTKPTYTADEVRAIPASANGLEENAYYDINGQLDILGYLGLVDANWQGVSLNGEYRDGKPLMTLWGSDGDEPVRLANLETPQNDDDAANKLYVDSTKLIVTASYSQASGFSERSHTSEEIIAAVQEGRNVRIDLYFEDEDKWHTYRFSQFWEEGSYLFTWTDGWNTLSSIEVYSDDTIWDFYHRILDPEHIGAAPTIRYGTTDVTAGSASSYPEGTLYVVIE